MKPFLLRRVFCSHLEEKENTIFDTLFGKEGEHTDVQNFILNFNGFEVVKSSIEGSFSWNFTQNGICIEFENNIITGVLVYTGQKKKTKK